MRRTRRSRELQAWYLYFVLYSVIGWCYEVFLEVVVYRWGFSNRGVLFGPWCVVYGFGALLLLAVLGPLQRKKLRLGRVPITPVLVFLGIAAVSTAVELLASYVMEWTVGAWMWDYTRFACNFQGRIALNPSLRFGVGGMVFLYVLQPLFRRLTDGLNDRLLAAVTAVLGALMAADVVYTFLLK